MDLRDFKGAARPLDPFDVPMLAHRINVPEDYLQAFLEVEASGRPFDRAGRPAMLFEPHLFYRFLAPGDRGRAVAAGLAYAKWGEEKYPKDSYPRLRLAMEIDEEAALRACSWGASQILGDNYEAAGYETVHVMVLDFMDDAQNHVEAMVKFILANNIDDDIRAANWPTVARVYNGPAYARHGYDKKLAAAAGRWIKAPDSGWAPDRPDAATPAVSSETITTVQNKLHDLGYHEVGKADGRWGTRTRAGVLAFRADNGLPIYAGIDDKFMATLITARPREISEARAHASAEDLRESGSATIAQTDQTKTVGVVTAGVTGAVALADQADGLTARFGSIQKLIDAAKPLTEAITDNALWIVAAVGIYLVWKSIKVQQIRVQDHRDGKNVGR